MLDSLLELEDKNPKAYWDIINKFKYSDKDISDQSSNIPSDEWYNNFDKLLNVDCSNEQDDFPSRYNVLLDYDINMQEVLKAIKSLKNNTSVGFDCISNEMLKHSSFHPKLVIKIFDDEDNISPLRTGKNKYKNLEHSRHYKIYLIPKQQCENVI
ncbi:unnamed protein product [Mytilus coruscus]|uniref:Uncharacterized protein n=1 Tax=Mytilus coruscus TaxID=42192 RepID=A0A6J8ELL2_MYTCO|nr:unnamed protein product [Mytilus coruscus]